MNTVDSLLAPIFQEVKTIQDLIPKKDKRILLSLHKQVNSGVFLTENQANLLVKIIEENLTTMTAVVPDAKTVLDTKHWSKPFREVKKIRKIYLSEEFPGNFVVEFSYNPQLREKMGQLASKIYGTLVTSGTRYIIVLNEQNVYSIIKTFGKLHFEIDEKLMNFYQEIREIQIKQKPIYDIFSTTHEKLKNAVINDITSIAPENALMLQDRKMRYQYDFSGKITENSLTAKIVNRTTRKVFIQSEKFSLDEVVSSLKELNRLPMLTVFDGHTSVKDKKYLKILEKSISSNQLGNEVGIYFRYNKEDNQEDFNKEVAMLNYNKVLSESTVVAGISNTKIPKFMIKTGWKPQTVISFTNAFRANKTYVYFSDVDLVIHYGIVKPLDSEVTIID